MSFILSKIFWVLMRPSNLLALILVLAALMARARPVLARRLLWTAVLGLLFLTFLPVGQWLILPIERRFPELVDLPAHVDGIIVLGGGVDIAPTIGRNHLALNERGERLTVSADLARRYPKAALVYTGFKGTLIDTSEKVPDIAKFYVRQGIDQTRIMVENASRNTYENAALTKEMVKPEPGQVWLLVTSVSHMPRALGVFRKIGWPVIAMPVDFRQPLTPGSRNYLSRIAQPSVGGSLHELDQAVKVWVGQIAYWLMGRTSALFPEP